MHDIMINYDHKITALSLIATYISSLCTENAITARTTHVKRLNRADIIVKIVSKREYVSPGLIHASQRSLHSLRTCTLL